MLREPQAGDRHPSLSPGPGDTGMGGIAVIGAARPRVPV